MGAVYRALDTRLDRAVAVKLLSGAPGADEQRFRAEVRTLARFVHPNLVRLLDAGEADGQLFLVMDLVEGTTLASRLSQGALSEEETAKVGTGVATALAYVHREGIVHRDVKPANILLDREGTAHLADFGIARLVDTTGMTATGLTLGTPGYLAPEQVQGATIGPPADVYALGLVLIECLTGQRAFAGTPAEVTAARLQRSPELPPRLDSDWRGMLASMTARAPNARIDASAVAAQLSERERSSLSAVTRALGPLVVADTVILDHPNAGTTQRLDPASSTLEQTEVAPVQTEVAPVQTEVAPVQTEVAPVQTEVAPVQTEVAPVQTEVTAVGSGASGSDSTWRSGTRRSMSLAAVGLVLLALLLGLTLGGVFSGSGSAPTPPKPALTTSTTASTTSTTTTTTTTTLATPSVATAAGGLVAGIEAGVKNGSIARQAGQQLDGQLQPLLFPPNPGPPQQQTQQFDQLVQSFYQDVANGQITSEATINSVTSSLDRLGAALGTSLPSPTTQTAPTKPTPGPPPGHGKGHGHGH
jgi:serine/threonine protein kinase